MCRSSTLPTHCSSLYEPCPHREHEVLLIGDVKRSKTKEEKKKKKKKKKFTVLPADRCSGATSRGTNVKDV